MGLQLYNENKSEVKGRFDVKGRGLPRPESCKGCSRLVRKANDGEDPAFKAIVGRPRDTITDDPDRIMRSRRSTPRPRDSS